jgi:hypothetical protein
MTGQFCSQQEITPVSPQDALSTLLNLLGITTPSGTTDVNLPDSTSTLTPSLMIVPDLAGTKTPMSQGVPAATLLPTSTNTLTPLPIATNTQLPTATNPPSPTETNPPPPTETNPPPPTETNPPPPTATNPPPPTPIPMITICHATGTGSYNEITIPNTGSGGHWNHPNDIIPAPAGGCP